VFVGRQVIPGKPMRRDKAGQLVILLIICVQVVCTAFVIVSPGTFFPLNRVLDDSEVDSRPTNAILDRSGRLLYELNDPESGAHYRVSLDEIPLALQQAIIATEDATFYINPGFDLAAILRAAWTNLLQGRIVTGASTITQQVIRQHTPPDLRYQQTPFRKLREVLFAYVLTRSLSKDDILSLYLNDTYFGHRAYGVEAASRIYFGKPVSQLDLAECSLLAGLPQSPVHYDPITNSEAAKERQRTVLDLLVKHRLLAPDEARLAASEPLVISSQDEKLDAIHFSLMVSQAMNGLVGADILQRGGLRIYTTLDLDTQHTSVQQLNRQLVLLNQQSDTEPTHNVRNGAVVVIEPSSGAIRALVGSPNYLAEEVDGAFNAALALRQPGSALKPIMYAAAFAAGLSPATMVADVPTSFTTAEGQPYSPQNYDRRFHGPVLLRQALACSYNVVAVKVLDRIGISAFTSLAQRLGMSSLDDASRYGLALTLGGVEVSLLELTSAYGVFANGGRLVQPYLIERIEDSSGRMLYQAAHAAPEPVLDERIAYLITDILSDPQARAPAFGASSALELPFAAAVKTGTTSAWRDNWTIGYSSEYVVGVWVGNADNQPMVQVSGVTGAAPIWNSIMRSIHSNNPPPFLRPGGITEVTVCSLSGQLPNAACTQLRQELFLAEATPQEICTMHQPSAAGVDFERSGTLSASIVWPPDLVNWARDQGLESAAVVSSQEPSSHKESSKPSITIESPADHTIYLMNQSLPPGAQQIEVLANARLAYDRLELYIDDLLYVTWQQLPFRTLWPLQAGTHTLYTIGTRADGSIERSAAVVFTVKAVSPQEERSTP
jgi:1A family penicillin-binding protein